MYVYVEGVSGQRAEVAVAHQVYARTVPSCESEQCVCVGVCAFDDSDNLVLIMNLIQEVTSTWLNLGTHQGGAQHGVAAREEAHRRDRRSVVSKRDVAEAARQLEQFDLYCDRV